MPSTWYLKPPSTIPHHQMHKKFDAMKLEVKKKKEKEREINISENSVKSSYKVKIASNCIIFLEVYAWLIFTWSLINANEVNKFR